MNSPTPSLSPILDRDPGTALSRSVPSLGSASRLGLFVADWQRVVFAHWEVPVDKLQPHVPFQLDLWHGRAYVSLVAFSMNNLRPERGGPWLRWCFRPFQHQRLLNLRAYVVHHGRPGICFLHEWINDAVNALIGPWLYGLPYRWSRNFYDHTPETGSWEGRVQERGAPGAYAYQARNAPAGAEQVARHGSLEEFLLERYSAFTYRRGVTRTFEVQHALWHWTPLELDVREDSLLALHATWWSFARLAGAQGSPGVTDVHMGPPVILPE